MWTRGHLIGAYRIIDCSSASETITTYSAERVGIDGFSRAVRLYALHPHLSTHSRFARAFVARARLFGSALHPRVVSVEDVGRAASRLYAVTSAPDAIPLSTLSCDGGGALSNAGCCAIVIQALEALSALHEAAKREPGLIHGSICPDALLIGSDGSTLLDGAASGFDLGVTLRCRRAFARRKYKAPEQLDGTGSSPASDIYALAVVLWELLTHTRYGRAESNRSSLDGKLAELVMSSMSHDAALRPGSAQEFRDRILDVEPAALGQGLCDVSFMARRKQTGMRELDSAIEPTTVQMPASVLVHSSRQARTTPVPEEPSPSGEEAVQTLDAVKAGALSPLSPPVRLVDAPALLASHDPRQPEVTAPSPTGRIERASVPSARLVVVDSPAVMLVLDAPSHRWVIGRGRSTDLVLDDIDASREHFELVQDETHEHWVYDLGSKNGLLVNGEPCHERRLADKDVIVAGHTRLRYEVAGS